MTRLQSFHLAVDVGHHDLQVVAQRLQLLDPQAAQLLLHFLLLGAGRALLAPFEV